MMISGFHKRSKKERIAILIENCGLNESDRILLESFDIHWNKEFQETMDKVSENVISNYTLPYSLIPNVRINDKNYLVPFVTEESSVVAAAASAAKFWANHGGFRCKVLDTKKCGHVYFQWSGRLQNLQEEWTNIQAGLLDSTKTITEGMRKRGGGILSITPDKVDGIQDEYRLSVYFDTQDAMGANFINSCLERIAASLKTDLSIRFPKLLSPVVTMAILSNHTPECTVMCQVECDVHALNNLVDGMNGNVFAAKFKRAVDIANNDMSRAVTHNKGIMNGVAGVVVATANDFRAVEAAAHAYAVKNGSYASLSSVSIENDLFSMQVTLPLALGTVGGLTSLHPMAALSLKILDDPSATTLMQLASACGLASNFSAIKSLISDGIQKGHMKMHLGNILLTLNASKDEELAVRTKFKGTDISTSAVRDFVKSIRASHEARF